MSTKGNKKNEPMIEDSSVDTVSTNIESSPSGSPCICKEKREIACTIHGG